MRIIGILSILFGAISLSSQEHFSDRLFIKVKEEYKNSYLLDLDSKVSNLFSKSKLVSIQPVSKHPLLNSTFELVFEKEVVLDSIIAQLNQLEQIDYAEKVPIYKLFFTPNDPLYSTQWNLAKIQADLAWNLGQGCTQVKIAVTDDGYLLNHEDLVNQWHINSGEINGNGIDDDGNGYIDDWRGWDAGSNDNDPSASVSASNPWDHGTHVAGIIAAKTHNSKGIASIGYNCKMIPIKIANNSYALTGAFAGLDYAINATNCDVINMSWGGAAPSATYQTLFNIAKSKGIICVAAAGNSNTSSPMYPASYNHVISVAASASTDSRASFSNFGSTIDVTAPGVGIPSSITTSISAYGNKSGTSMAAPLVAGLCGLMKCYNPMPADSIEACLKRTCDNINAQNPSFIGQLGAGRINAFQALQCLTKKPKSDFIALDTFQCIGKSVRYAVKSFGIPTLTYSWSFLGGTPAASTSANPAVTYATNGLKSATLITCNSLGCDTMTKTNYINIDTPKAWLTNRKYTSYNSNPVIITVHFKGNPPFNVTLTDGTNNFTQTNIRSNPYFFSIVPIKDTSLISISSFSDSSCIGNKFGLDTIYKITFSNGGVQYCESSFKFTGTSNNVVRINPQNGAAWKDLYSTSGFTWECWFNPSSNPYGANHKSLVTAIDANICEDIGLHFNWPNSNSLNFVVSGQTGCGVPRNWASTSVTFSPNTWYHAAGVMDYSANIVRLYINGIQVSTASLTLPMSQRMQNNVAVTIGNQDVNYNPYTSFSPFDGKIDEVRFWNTVRTASEIQANYKACLAANTSNLVAYFKADEGTGTSTTSLINGNFVGTLQNNASWDSQTDSVKNCTICSKTKCIDSNIIFTDTSWQYQNTSGTWVPATLGINSCGQYAHATWSPSVLIGLTNQNQMIWGSTTASTCTVRKQINIPDKSIIDSIRIKVQGDDNVVSMKINGTTITSTPFGWNNISNLSINNSNLVNGLNTFTLDGTNSGSCAWLAMKMIIYTSKDCGSDCDTTNLNTGKVLHLDFNGNTQDKSGNGNHATNYGATPVAGKAGIANTAYRFDSTNYMSVAHHSSLNLRSFTLTAILKPLKFNTDICYTNNVINKGTASVGAQWALQYAPTTSTTCFNRDTSNCNMFICGSACPPSNSVTNTLPYMVHNKWECAVLTYDSISKEVKMYMNGVLRHQWTSTFTSLTSQNAAAVLIGKFGDPTYPGFIQAVIDDIRIYNRVLAPSEVKGYCGTCDIPPSQITCNNWLKSTGSNDRVTIGDLDLINDKFTIEALVNNIDTSTDPNWEGREIVSKHGGPTDINYNMRSTFTSVTTDSSLIQSGLYKFYFTPPICKSNLNKTYHIASVYDGNSLKFYRNGFLMSQVPAKGKPILNNYSTTIGNYAAGSNFPTKGYINEVRIWNVARSQSEIKQFMDKSLPNPTSQTGLLAYYTFDNLLNKQGNTAYNGTLGGGALINQTNPNCSLIIDSCEVPIQPPLCDTSGLVLCMSMDGNANDSTKYAHHGIVRGATPTSNRFGNSNSAYLFNGTSNYINLGNKSLLKPNKATISMWIKPNANSTNGYGYQLNPLFVTGNTNSPGNMSEAYFMGISTNGNTKFHSSSWNPATSTSSGGYSNQNYSLSTWYHMTTTFDNDSLKIYINGVLDKAFYKGFTTNYSTIDSIIIAYSGNNTNNQRWFNGAIDDIKMYNRVLSATEVSNLYTKPFTCSCNSIQPPPCDTAKKYTHTQCLNDSIQISASAGSKYQWSPVFGLSKDTIQNPKVFVTNNQRYLVSYTSLKNCQLIDTIEVEVKAAAIYPKMDDQLICIGDSLQMTIPIYATNIVWSPNTAISSTSSKNPFFFPTTSTTYYLEFRDTFGCLHRDTFVVNTKVCCPARARFTIPKDMLCFGETLLITNTSKGPITSYNWNFSTAIPNTFSSANPPSLSFPSGGSYTLRLIVTNGTCFDTMIKTVNLVHIIPNAGRDTTNCLGAFVTDLGESPISDWTYKWTPSKYLDDPNIANPKCSIVNDSVNYVLEIVDRNSGCKAYDTVVVYTNRHIDSTVQNLRICGGDSVLYNGIQRKTTGNYYFTIKKADGICDSFIDVLQLNVLEKQMIGHTDTSVCEVYFDPKGKKYINSFIQYDTIKSKTILNCDSLVYFRNVNIFHKVYRDRLPVSGCAPFRYNGKTYLVSKMKADSIRIRNIFMNDCDTIEYINIIVHPKPKAVITPSIPNPVFYKQTVTLTASGGQTYLWLQTGSTNQEIDYKINNIQPKLYTVRVTDENDCWDTVSYLIKGELPDTCFYGFPNVFSPNLDNLNDVFIPNMDECTDIIVFAIYDRWGEKVFETNQLKGWNGYFKGRPAPLGVYLYYAELNTPWGIRLHKGTFTLMR